MAQRATSSLTTAPRATHNGTNNTDLLRSAQRATDAVPEKPLEVFCGASKVANHLAIYTRPYFGASGAVGYIMP